QGNQATIFGQAGVTAAMSTGTLSLSTANTYTGNTQILPGTVVVNGSLPASGAVIVNAGATLAGTGSVGILTVNGGTVAPGPVGGIGVLIVSSADFSNGGNLLIRIQGYKTPGTDYSQLMVTNALTLGGTSSVTFDEMNKLSKKGTAAGI